MSLRTPPARYSAVVSILLLGACGGAADPVALADEGRVALAAGRPGPAAEAFEDALAAIGADTAHPQYLGAKLGLIEATAAASGARAKDDFLALATTHAANLGEREYDKVGRALLAGGFAAEATYVYDAGLRAHPGSKVLEAGIAAVRQAAESGDAGAASALDGLGYTGGKEE
jgi:hypothetical protein